MVRINSLIILLMLFLAACGSTTLQSTNTPDICADAILVGAREKLTLEQITPCLKTVSQVSTFMKNNVIYDVEYDFRERGGNEYVPASIVYERGIDDGDGYAILQCYFLEQNGWDAFMIGLSIESATVGSNACGVLSSGKIIVLEGERVTAGPFDSLADAARHYIDIGWMTKGGSLRTLKASQITQVTTDNTVPSVLDLPWEFHQY